MQIVIDIDDKYKDMISNINPRKGAIINDIILDAVKNGTPLPKGHGRLIDADNIKTAFPSGEYVRTESVRATIEHEDTIIEADKGSEE